jgi:hypothetical protein
MTTRTLARITVVAAALASSPFVAAAAVPHSLSVSAKLTVTGTAASLPRKHLHDP